MKKIILITCFFLIGCYKPELVVPIPTTPKSDIFNVKESVIKNAQDITFKLITPGYCTLTIKDSTTNQVVTREKLTGIMGENKIKIYTNSLPKGYLILVLEDINKNQLGRTIIINN